MYGAIWHVLPGPWPVKLLFVLAFIAVVLFACVAWVFPWIDQLISPEPEDVTVGMAAMMSMVPAHSFE